MQTHKHTNKRCISGVLQYTADRPFELTTNCDYSVWAHGLRLRAAGSAGGREFNQIAALSCACVRAVRGTYWSAYFGGDFINFCAMQMGQMKCYKLSHGRQMEME